MKMTKNIKIAPIGYVRNGRETLEDDNWGGIVSQIELDDGIPEDSLDGIDSYSHLEIIFYFHKADRSKIILGREHPRENIDWPKVGIFAQRKKGRPNLIGTTIVKLVKRQGRTIHVTNLDAINGTPVIDIKPVLKEFLPKEEVSQPEWSKELMKNYWNRSLDCGGEVDREKKSKAKGRRVAEKTLYLKKIISGGQTGVDRAALDLALELGIPCGGWCPKGRLAEDGAIEARYPLRETRSPEYPVRTERNVKDSDATLILTRGEPTEGTARTLELAKIHKKPYFAVDLSEGEEDPAAVREWLQEEKVEVLNVAGPRESNAPGIHDRAMEFLRRVLQKAPV